MDANGARDLVLAVSALRNGRERTAYLVLALAVINALSLALTLLVEVLVIGPVCAGIAVMVAWLAVNGHEVGSSAMGSAIQFRMRVGAGVVGWTFAYVLILWVYRVRTGPSSARCGRR